MEKELFDFVAERANILAAADTSKQDTKEAAQAWKDAVAADDSDASVEAATNALLDFLEDRMLGIDALIAFAEGPAVDIMGAEVAAGMLAGAKARKAEGWKYCICEAHVAAAELLGKFGRIEL
ncbi:MAG: 3-hydroxyisobutyrate dehydrogenase [Eggerthellaceae bacterium]|nr:3-hydroxyisobutyrate dehydrogenase [Eggerthellaceae bacterium]MBR2803865.1 3-hydroxyisobutyrate dehydrogenase [Eggerthellaceae bacterium]